MVQMARRGCRLHQIFHQMLCILRLSRPRLAAKLFAIVNSFSCIEEEVEIDVFRNWSLDTLLLLHRSNMDPKKSENF